MNNNDVSVKIGRIVAIVDYYHYVNGSRKNNVVSTYFNSLSTSPNIEYKVVVFPEPVGPEIKIRPKGL